MNYSIPGGSQKISVSPELEKFGLKFNHDFFCYSPEIIILEIKTIQSSIVKVTSGSTPVIAKYVDDLYKQIVEAGTHPASSIKVAEASKVIENIKEM